MLFQLVNTSLKERGLVVVFFIFVCFFFLIFFFFFVVVVVVVVFVFLSFESTSLKKRELVAFSVL